MRCLEKDRTRRYATPSELVADIDRHLRHEPVTARPPSTGYLLRKVMRRHRLAFAAGTAVAVSLIGGLVVSSLLYVRERREAAKSAQVARFMKDMLKGVGPSKALGLDTKLLRRILDTTERRLETELPDQPVVSAELRDTLGAVYIELLEPR